jgi:uncharacterized membrane protein YciS (DUF1049 family)
MIVVVMIVCITIIIKGIFSIHRNKKQLKELEQRLNDYYKEREQRLKDKGLIE